MQGSHKLAGSLNVTLSFPPSCLGRGLETLLIWHLNLEETGARAPWFMFCPPCSLCDSPVSSANKTVHRPLQVGGCRLLQLLRTHQGQRNTYKPTPPRRSTQPGHPVQHVPPRACPVALPQRGGHCPTSPDAEERLEAPGRRVYSAAGEGTGLSSEEGPVPGGFRQSGAGDGCSGRRDPGRPPRSGDRQCAAGHPEQPAASGNAVRGVVSEQFRGVGCQIYCLGNVAVTPLSPFQLPFLWHPPCPPALQPPSHASDTAHLLCWMCCHPSPGEEMLSKGHLPVLVTRWVPLLHQAHFPAE